MIIFHSISRLLFFVALVLPIWENMKYFCSDAFDRLCHPVNRRRVLTFQHIFSNNIVSSRIFSTDSINSKFNKPETNSPTAIKGRKLLDDYYSKSNGKSTKKFILVTGGVISGIG